MNVKTARRSEVLPMARIYGFLGRIHVAQPTTHGEGTGDRNWAICREDGATLVEMGLSCAVMLVLLFGIIQMSMALYAYNFVAEAAREATRYAVVRGSNSCVISSTFPDCNLTPVASGNSGVAYTTSPLQTYVRGRGFPFADRMNVTASWLIQSQDASGHMTWPTACTGAADPTTGNPCNNVGYAVQATVSYAYPLNIPFLQPITLNIHSTSQMVISE